MTARAPAEIRALSLHDALPISRSRFRETAARHAREWRSSSRSGRRRTRAARVLRRPERDEDRKSTRLNSSHITISYAVFCLKKKIKDRFEQFECRRSQVILDQN